MDSVILGRWNGSKESAEREKNSYSKNSHRKVKGMREEREKIVKFHPGAEQKKKERKKSISKKREQIQTTRLFLAIQFTSSPQHNDQQFHHYQ